MKEMPDLNRSASSKQVLGMPTTPSSSKGGENKNPSTVSAVVTYRVSTDSEPSQINLDYI